MRNYFEEMNIDYDELKRYEDIETYYDEVQDYINLIKELQCDRVEALKQIVNKNREIERLNEDIRVFEFTIKTQQEQIQELIEREDKAIEYIEDRFFINEETGEYCLTHTFDNSNLYELMKILDKEV